MAPQVDVALIHHPVVDKNGRVIAAALTPTDLHDLARSARTYGVARLWVVTPLIDQQKLARRMLGFWQEGVGAAYNPNRGQALDLVRVAGSLEEAIGRASEEFDRRPLVWATSARGGEGGDKLDYSRAGEILSRERPALILFGTAWGLAPSVLAECDNVLAPIGGVVAGDGEGYNHLSVRSAAAVVLDRLLGR